MRTHELPDIGDLAIAVGLACIEFRLAEIRWRDRAPNMVNWFDQINNRQSMRLAVPE